MPAGKAYRYSSQNHTALFAFGKVQVSRKSQLEHSPSRLTGSSRFLMNLADTRVLASRFSSTAVFGVRSLELLGIEAVQALRRQDEPKGISSQLVATLARRAFRRPVEPEDYASALEFYEQALPLRRQVGDRSGEAGTQPHSPFSTFST